MKTNSLSRLRSRIYIVTTVAIAGLTISLTPPAQAGTVDLVKNGEFTDITHGTNPMQLTTPTTQLSFDGAVLADWHLVSGLAFLFGPSNAGNTSMTNADISPGAPNHFGHFCLYGPGSCGASSANGLTLGPNKSNFLALDGALTDPAGIPLRAEIQQTITGLTPGEPATVTFNWAGGQQSHFLGATTQQLQVSLCPTSASCNNTLETGMIGASQGGFSAWRAGETNTGHSFTFTPTSSSEVLSFLAIGTPATAGPDAGPPFVLLESVKLNQEQGPEIPEPGTWSLLGIGFAATVGVAYRRPKWLSLPA